MRYIIGFLIAIGLIVLTFVLIFKAFSGGDNGVKQSKIDLNSYSTTDAVVRYTIDGPVNADSIHHRIRITVGRDQTLFEEIDGYQGKVQMTKTYDNNPDAYAAFLHSLTIAGFASGDSKVTKDERGYCPLGRRYVYEAMSNGDDVLRWWSTSCGSSLGSFKGKSDTIRSLFQNQIPDYNKLTLNFTT